MERHDRCHDGVLDEGRRDVTLFPFPRHDSVVGIAGLSLEFHRHLSNLCAIFAVFNCIHSTASHCIAALARRIGLQEGEHQRLVAKKRTTSGQHECCPECLSALHYFPAVDRTSRQLSKQTVCCKEKANREAADSILRWCEARDSQVPGFRCAPRRDAPLLGCWVDFMKDVGARSA